MDNWKAFLFLTFLLTIGATKTFACSCGGRPLPCQDYWDASAVFIGTVNTVAPTTYKLGEREFRGRLVHFAIDRVFQGDKDTELYVMTGPGGGGDCGYNFRPGGQYLVYAYRNTNNQLATGICNRTRLLSEAAEDLDYFEGLAKAKSGAHIFGEVRRRDRPDSDRTPVSEVKVVVEGSSKRFEAVTNEGGNFRISGLPAGFYKVNVELPEGLAIHKSEREVTVKDRGCAEVDFFVQADTRIAGTVLDAAGQPVPEISIELMPVPGGSEAYPTSATTDQKGRYELKLQLPGRYLLGVRIFGLGGATYVAYPRTYYPGVSEECQATVIILAEGQQLKLNDLILPPRLLERSLNGLVVDANGQPLGGVAVWLKETEYVNKDMPYRTTTDSDGQFSFKTYEGMSYHLNAYLELSDNKRKQAQTDVRITSTTGTIRLVLSEPK